MLSLGRELGLAPSSLERRKRKDSAIEPIRKLATKVKKVVRAKLKASHHLIY
jgi:hypothetical protein